MGLHRDYVMCTCNVYTEHVYIHACNTPCKGWEALPPYERSITRDSLELASVQFTPPARAGIKREVNSENLDEKKAKARFVCKYDGW